MQWGASAQEDKCLDCVNGYDLDENNVCVSIKRDKDVNCRNAD